MGEWGSWWGSRLATRERIVVEVIRASPRAMALLLCKDMVVLISKLLNAMIE